jgi:hypothetical protein
MSSVRWKAYPTAVIGRDTTVNDVDMAKDHRTAILIVLAIQPLPMVNRVTVAVGQADGFGDDDPQPGDSNENR